MSRVSLLTLLTLLAGLTSASTQSIAGADPAADLLTAPATVLPMPPVPEAAAMDAEPVGLPVVPAPIVTLPSQRMPQYDWPAVGPGSPVVDAVWLQLAHPVDDEPPLIIRVEVTIDGERLSERRSRQIDELMKQLATREPPSTETTESPELDESSESDEPGRMDEPDAAAIRYEFPNTTLDRISRFAAATADPPDLDRDLDRDLTGWLVSQWTDGPPVVMLPPYFGQFRQHQRPVVDVLDGDGDGALSPSEIAAAEAAFTRCDANRDGLCDGSEIVARATALRTDPRPPIGRPLLTRLDADESSTRPPDLVLQVRFATADPAASTLMVSLSPAAAERIAPVEDNLDGVNLDAAGVRLNLTAMQRETIDATSTGPLAPVSLGAVVDGFPLFPLLDRDADGRLTIREQRAAPQRLLQLDQDHNGQLQAAELQPPVRLAVGLGPVVHDPLSQMRTLRVDESDELSPPPPAWFVRMDRNADADLSRVEFPGSDAQFAALDADADGLISAAEAAVGGD